MAVITAPTAVYRFFDSIDRLIYVGITRSPNLRWKQHEERDWWPTVARSQIEWCDTRDEAEKLESKYISEDSPLMNRTGRNVSPMPSKGRPKEIVRISEEVKDALAKKAADEGVSKSAIMRRAIEKELGIVSDSEPTAQ